MITPDKSAEGPRAESCVAVDAFETGGGAPEVGTDVEFSGKGRVTRVANGHVYFETTEVNGQPVVTPNADVTEDDVMRMAQEMDAAAG